MKRALALFLLLAGCGAAPDQGNQVPIENAGTAANPAEAPAFDARVDPQRLALLCDPERFRLSIRHRADAASLDRSYPRRTVIDPKTLVQLFPNQGGEDQYQGSLIRYERCGPFIVRLQGDFLNANLAGEMGAIEPFLAASVMADSRLLYPVHPSTERHAIRLAPCDERLPIWRECPADCAVRVDLDYRPESKRLAIHEWASSGDMLDERAGRRITERRSEVRAMLGLWWGMAHPDAPPEQQY